MRLIAMVAPLVLSPAALHAAPPSPPAAIIAADTGRPAAGARRFVLAGKAPAGSIAVAAGRHYADGYGFEDGGPTLFSVAATPGNYRVTVTVGRRDAPTRSTIKAESRRLMLDDATVPAGHSITRSFIVNVRDAALTPPPLNAPGGTHVLLKPREQGSFGWDDRLTLELLGDAPSAILVEPVAVPTMFLLGDSTVTDQQAEPAASWGQMLPVFFKPDIAVANHAESGETLKSFMSELRFAKVLESVKPGDVALIQFGHNDQKAQWPQTYAAADTTYRDYLRAWIAEFRRRGVTPILVTSPERRMWTGARIRATLGDYAAAAKAVAAAEGVAVIDLNAASVAFYEALGPARAPLAFNDGGKDATHHDNYGAWVLARAVAQGLAALPVGAHLRDDIGRFDPARPPDPATFRLAPSGKRDATRPDGN
ncbi:rhamnogalacturonan acetylesterase [Sphingomonas sp. A2-49]|uniref:rhamnogalacturonan acetylesterase n=1 Tax=Sphingomonas sp. A2-49 TaxID=1391375 RepID=UPI0021CDF45E|nr:rhamnogalacturonan acetylesterase [Sphingomonas sp. A2-49]MCU6453718.1 rhamnogalacturonan acetylesterase [Sphingomonas sp. A2-49]